MNTVNVYEYEYQNNIIWYNISGKMDRADSVRLIIRGDYDFECKMPKSCCFLALGFELQPVELCSPHCV